MKTKKLIGVIAILGIATVAAIVIFNTIVNNNDKNKGANTFINEENVIVASVSKPDYINQHFFDASQYADSVKFIRLETTDESLIGGITELLFDDDYVIVADRKTASIFFFDYEGNYSHKINRRGQGEGEYLSLSHVMLDKENDEIIILDMNLRALLRYDYQGNQISKISNFDDDMVPRDIIKLPSGDFLCYRQDRLGDEEKWQAGVWKVKKDGSLDKFIYTLDFDTNSSFVQSVYHLSYLHDGKISFVDQNKTAVFSIDENDIVSKIVEFKVPGKTLAEMPTVDKSDGGYYSIFCSEEKGDYIFTQWIDPENRVFQTILTKSTGKIETGMAFYPFVFGTHLPGNSFVRNNNPKISSSYFYPSTILQYTQLDLPDEYKQPAEKIIEGMTLEEIEDSNPIIQLLYIK
ncbi:hypothetical protein M2138_001232 [Dysgonomonadaceae bacterium PH5-43]|nr:hypothetical protein [Dysgonomonadaceae bacterium PH5-43]